MERDTKTGHTPGPWRVDDGDRVVGPMGNTVADCPGYSVKATNPLHQQRGGREANARLISAAPELLEALEALLAERYALEEPEQFDANGNWTSDSPASVQARLAIAKARGGGV